MDEKLHQQICTRASELKTLCEEFLSRKEAVKQNNEYYMDSCKFVANSFKHVGETLSKLARAVRKLKGELEQMCGGHQHIEYPYFHLYNRFKNNIYESLIENHASNTKSFSILIPLFLILTTPEDLTDDDVPVLMNEIVDIPHFPQLVNRIDQLIRNYATLDEVKCALCYSFRCFEQNADALHLSIVKAVDCCEIVYIGSTSDNQKQYRHELFHAIAEFGRIEAAFKSRIRELNSEAGRIVAQAQAQAPAPAEQTSVFMGEVSTVNDGRSIKLENIRDDLTRSYDEVKRCNQQCNQSIKHLVQCMVDVNEKCSYIKVIGDVTESFLEKAEKMKDRGGGGGGGDESGK